MDFTSALWGLNSGLIIILGFFVKKWIHDLELKVDKKAEKETCENTHSLLNRLAHSHASAGQAGEVVPR
jgi:hypothetical protein